MDRLTDWQRTLSFVWLCLTFYAFVWLCMTLHDCAWLCMTVIRMIHQSLKTKVSIRNCIIRNCSIITRALSVRMEAMMVVLKQSYAAIYNKILFIHGGLKLITPCPQVRWFQNSTTEVLLWGDQWSIILRAMEYCFCNI